MRGVFLLAVQVCPSGALSEPILKKPALTYIVVVVGVDENLQHQIGVIEIEKANTRLAVRRIALNIWKLSNKYYRLRFILFDDNPPVPSMLMVAEEDTARAKSRKQKRQNESSPSSIV
jgi:hypothetical protein